MDKLCSSSQVDHATIPFKLIYSFTERQGEYHLSSCHEIAVLHRGQDEFGSRSSRPVSEM